MKIPRPDHIKGPLREKEPGSRDEASDLKSVRRRLRGQFPSERALDSPRFRLSGPSMLRSWSFKHAGETFGGVLAPKQPGTPPY